MDDTKRVVAVGITIVVVEVECPRVSSVVIVAPADRPRVRRVHKVGVITCNLIPISILIDTHFKIH